MARFGMVIDTKRCVGCMDCVVACKTENDVPDGHCRDWISQRLQGEMPTCGSRSRSERCNHCDSPPCVTCCPTGASHVQEFGKVVLVDHEQMHRLQGLSRRVPVRRALHPPRRLCRQVHVLHAPGRRRPGASLCRRLPDPLHAFRRSRRPRVRGEPPDRHASSFRAEAGCGYPAAHLLPGVTRR